jgi:hypothetical protein
LFSTIRQWTMNLPDWRAQLWRTIQFPIVVSPRRACRTSSHASSQRDPATSGVKSLFREGRCLGHVHCPMKSVTEEYLRIQLDCAIALSTVASSHAELRRKLRAARMRTTINDSYCWLDVRELSTERTCVLPAWRAKKSDPLQIYTIGCGALQGTSQADEMCARS